MTDPNSVLAGGVQVLSNELQVQQSAVINGTAAGGPNIQEEADCGGGGEA